MRKIFPALLALTLVACRPTETPNSGSQAASSTQASAIGHATLEEITKAVQTACEARNADALMAISQTQGEPPELTAAIKPMFKAMLSNTNVSVSEVKAVEFATYETDRELPGEFNDKPLEYLVPPSHWILVTMSSPEGKQPKINLKLTFPTAKIDGKWMLVGARYKK
jgi:hypothetical protein